MSNASSKNDGRGEGVTTPHTHGLESAEPASLATIFSKGAGVVLWWPLEYGCIYIIFGNLDIDKFITGWWLDKNLVF
jgi:hypothetical protein